MQLKKEKEKLNKVLEEKDFIINKLINENNERNSTCSQNIFDSIDFHLSEIKKEAESIFESSKRKIDSQSIFKNKNEPTMKKITDLKNKFEISCKVIVDLSNYFENNSDKLETLDFVSEKKHLNLLLNNVPIESENRELKNELCKQEDISSNVKLELNENKEIQNKYYPELNILKHKIQKKEKVKNKTKTKQLLQDKIEEYKKKIQKNSKVLKELNIVNEVLASNINKLNTERALMLEKQQITDEKFEKIIKVMKEEKEINKQKYSPLNKKYSSNPDHSDDDTHQYEKIIELKSSEIMQLNNQIKNLSIKILEEHNKNNFISKQKESVIESKNQEILNLKIDLNKIENKLQLQCEEFENLKRIHHAKLEKFDFLLEEKKNEIREIRKELRDAEDLINQERKIATSILDFSSTNNENLKEEKGERENDKIKNLEIENDKLKKDLRFIKKSLKETLDQNDSYSQDLQKIRLRSYFLFHFIIILLFYIYL